MKKLYTVFIMVIVLSINLPAEEYTWSRTGRGVGTGFFTAIGEDSLNNIYLAGNYVLLKSDDDGRSWDFIREYIAPIKAISCSEDETVYLSSDSIYYSDDECNTIKAVEEEGFQNYLHASLIHFSLVYTKFFLINSHCLPDKEDTTKTYCYSAFYRSYDKGKNWDTIKYKGELILQPMFLEPFFDQNGGMYVISGNDLLYLKDFHSEFQKMEGFPGYKWKNVTSQNFLTGHDGKTFYSDNKAFYYLNTQTLQCEPFPMPLPYFYNVRYYKGTYFMLNGSYLFASYDNLQSVEIIREAPYGHMVPPTFEITRKGAIIYKDEEGAIYRGVPVTGINEKDDAKGRYNRSFDSPNSFYEYAMSLEQEIKRLELFDVQGSLLLKAEDISDPNLPEMISGTGSSLLFYKIVCPKEIYYGKVLNVR